MKQKDPLVSVVMATYNEPPEILSKAVESILNQTYTNIELLVLDDSTSIKTKECLESYTTDKRVKIYREPRRMGFVPALNMGLETAKGKYIARMDGDDISLPDRIEKEVGFLENNPSVSVVGGQINIIDGKGNIQSTRKYPKGGVRLRLYSSMRCPLAHPAVMMRRTLIDQGYRYDEKLKMSEDLDFWLRLMNDGYKLANISDTILQYRVMDNFVEKRTSDGQRKTMAYVRRKNFTKKHLLHSTISVSFGWIFSHISKRVIDNAYRQENKLSFLMVV